MRDLEGQPARSSQPLTVRRPRPRAYGDRWEARLAYNWRSERYVGGQQGDLAGYQDSIGYLDGQVTYAINDNIFVYLNGSNITGESEDYFIDFGAGPSQYWQQNEFEARYTVGVRGRFDN